MIEAKAVQAGWSPAGKSAGKSVRISHRELRQLTRKSGLRSALVIAAQWLIISAAMAVAIWLDAWYGYLLAIVVIASRQHALGVLMHDAAHFLLFKNRLLNDVVSELFLAFPLFVSTSLYRHHHFLHHGHLNTDQDPDLDSESAQRSRVEWLRLFTGDLLGLSLLKTADTVTQWSMLGLLGKKRSERPPLQPWQLPLFLFFLAALAAVLTLTGGWLAYLVLWIVPMVTVLSAIFRYRSAAEHVACEQEHELNATRTVVSNPVERFFLAPLNVNYHLEHHLYPRVPFHNLGRLHRRLYADRDYRENAHINRSYLFGRDSVLREIVLRSGSATEETTFS